MLCNTAHTKSETHQEVSLEQQCEQQRRIISASLPVFAESDGGFKGCMTKYGTREKKLEIFLQGEQVRAAAPTVRGEKKHLEWLHISIQGLDGTQQEQ